MLSKAYTHYPQFRFRDGQKLLWNPILKKTFKNRPEERVRLQLIDYLTLEAGFSSQRLSFESPVKLEGEKSLSRTDLIAYDKQFDPLLLVECKAPDIKLDEKAALQIARYNQQIDAPFLLVSNGMLDFWYQIESSETSIQRLTEIPSAFAPSPKNDEDTAFEFTYWTDRAFAGHKLVREYHDFINRTCRDLFKNPLKPIKFLSFEGMPAELALDNYYRIFQFGDQLNVALSFAANSYGGTRLNAILNKQGANTAFLSASLDLIAEGETDNTHLQSGRGTFTLDLLSHITFDPQSETEQYLSGIKELLIENS